MAVLEQTTSTLSYEDYLSEGVIEGRYEIIDGVRYMTGATRRHNRIAGRIWSSFLDFEIKSGTGKAYLAPSDLILSTVPLRTRQPDVFFMSNERVSQNPSEESPAGIVVGPEIAVEVLSPSDSGAVLAGKLSDYVRLSIDECWLLSTASQTVRVMMLRGPNYVEDETYSSGEVVRSRVFGDLRVAVDDIFRA